MKMGIALMMQPAGGWRWVLNLTGQVVAILTYNFLRDSEYCNEKCLITAMHSQESKL